MHTNAHRCLIVMMALLFAMSPVMAQDDPTQPPAAVPPPVFVPVTKGTITIHGSSCGVEPEQVSRAYATPTITIKLGRLDAQRLTGAFNRVVGTKEQVVRGKTTIDRFVTTDDTTFCLSNATNYVVICIPKSGQAYYGGTKYPVPSPAKILEWLRHLEPLSSIK